MWTPSEFRVLLIITRLFVVCVLGVKTLLVVFSTAP